MKKILLPLTGLITLLWAIDQPNEVLGFSASFFEMRQALTVLSGAVAFGWMAYTMLLALRPAWLERQLGGLDKLFREHKWAGIGAVLLVVSHWLLVLSPRTLIEWGWVAAPAGGRRPQGAGGDPLIGMARDGGEWAAWLMIGLAILALLRFVPYGWFRKAHKGFPVVFLIGAFHSVVLTPEGPFASPLGVLVSLLAAGGSVIAVMSLGDLIGRKRRTPGQLVSVTTQKNGVLDVRVQPSERWPGHRAGQFALLTLDAREGSHPFTIASDWSPDAPLRFTIKPLGDYTRTLAERIKPGQAAVIEGPYGRFDFTSGGGRQVWVAGGIGVAPFLARLEALAASGGAAGGVDFFYCVATEADAGFPAGLEDLCQRAGVTLHRRVDSRDGRIGADEIGGLARHASSVWFCGPPAWGKALRKDLRDGYGVRSHNFHAEAFQFR